MIDFSKTGNLSNTTRYYLVNCCLSFVVLFSVAIMFFVQFKVDNLKDQVAKVDMQISELDDEIRVLEVEWVYLTRPERLRDLSSRYLQDNGYILAEQVKDDTLMEKYFVAALQKTEDVASR